MIRSIAETSAVERVARVLCAQRLSSNAEGSNPSASNVVDLAWREHVDDAEAVLRTLREPDPEMAAAGDPAVWERMVLAALGDAPREAPQAYEPPPPGTDPLHEGP
jgi:hypothetical protein